MSAVRAVETRAEVLPENDNDRLLEDDIERSEQKEHLYLDVLYAIANTVGAPAPGGQVTLDTVFLSGSPCFVSRLSPVWSPIENGETHNGRPCASVVCRKPIEGLLRALTFPPKAVVLNLLSGA